MIDLNTIMAIAGINAFAAFGLIYKLRGKFAEVETNTTDIVDLKELANNHDKAINQHDKDIMRTNHKLDSLRKDQDHMQQRLIEGQEMLIKAIERDRESEQKYRDRNMKTHAAISATMQEQCKLATKAITSASKNSEELLSLLVKMTDSK